MNRFLSIGIAIGIGSRDKDTKAPSSAFNN